MSSPLTHHQMYHVQQPITGIGRTSSGHQQSMFPSQQAQASPTSGDSWQRIGCPTLWDKTHVFAFSIRLDFSIYPCSHFRCHLCEGRAAGSAPADQCLGVAGKAYLSVRCPAMMP